MYKVFVKDIPIILSTEENIGEHYTTIPLKQARFKKLVKKINNGELLYVNLYHKNAEKLERFLRKKIKAYLYQEWLTDKKIIKPTSN